MNDPAIQQCSILAYLYKDMSNVVKHVFLCVHCICVGSALSVIL